MKGVERTGPKTVNGASSEHQLETGHTSLQSPISLSRGGCDSQSSCAKGKCQQVDTVRQRCPLAEQMTKVCKVQRMQGHSVLRCDGVVVG